MSCELPNLTNVTGTAKFIEKVYIIFHVTKMNGVKVKKCYKTKLNRISLLDNTTAAAARPLQGFRPAG